MVQPSAIAVNGTRLYVEEAGAGPAVVFLHQARQIHISFVE